MNTKLHENLAAIRADLTPEKLDAPDWIELARLAKEILEAIADGSEAPEYMSECIVNGDTLGEFLMQNIGPETDAVLDKRKWLDVAEVIGPDHAQTLYHAAVFVTRVA